MVVSHIQSRAAIIAPRNGITLPTNRKAYSPQHGCRYRPRLMTNQERIVTRVHNEVEQRTGEATYEEKRTLYGCLSSRTDLGHGSECWVGFSCAAFLDELRKYAMKLHTREQAPAEGQAEAPKDQKPVRTSLHLSFFVFTLFSYGLFRYPSCSLCQRNRGICVSWRNPRLSMMPLKL